MKLSSNRFVYEIMGCAMRVHEALGCGFLEAVYGDALEVEFRKCGIPCVREDDIQVYYDGAPLKTHYRADFTCYGRQVIVELKAIKSISKVEWSQVLHYMKATKIPYALLVNFGRLSLQYDAFDADAMASVFAAADEGDSATDPRRAFGGVGATPPPQEANPGTECC